jgi:Alpha-L-rhamnosidase N-terminal domain./Bacterial alpha-L-rhamnosidase.
MRNPLGIGENPYFSWIIDSDDRDVMQEAYRLVVRHDDMLVWDTGRIESDKAAYIEYAGQALTSGSLYSWTVTAWDNHGHEASASAIFETALLKPSDWKASWVESALRRSTSKKGFGKQPPATMFRKAFTLKAEVVKARLYATCHGIYRLTVNGQRPDDREFAPEHTSYDSYLCYQTYDVTRLLIRGDNALGMYVGDGWYLGPRTRPRVKPYRCRPAALFQLEVSFADGSFETIVSDSGVTTSYGPVLFSDLFSGEKYDANLEQAGWDAAGFDDSAWKPARIAKNGYGNLAAQLGEPVRPVATLPVISLFTSPKGERILDFGQNLAGRLRMRVRAPKGATVTLEHFEVLDKEGNYFNNVTQVDAVEQKDEFVSAGAAAEYEPLFTFHGFRYVRVSGLGELQPEDFTAVALSSEKESVGTFECSDARLNRLYENTRWSQRSNMLSIPTDCPQREKAGWTGDIQLYATTALLNEDATAFLSRWLSCVARDQGENGAVPIVVPFDGMYPKVSRLLGLMFGNRGTVGSAGWGDAAVLVPYQMYKVTGNDAILRRQYESMRKWCGYVIETARKHRGKGSALPDEIERYLWNTGFHWGEWLIPSQSRTLKNKELLASTKISMRYTAPIFAYLSVSAMAESARAIGRDEDASYYADMAAKIKDAFGSGLIDEKGDMPAELMGAYALPLRFDLVPDRYRVHFADKLVAMIRDNGGCLDTGFLATPFILDALCTIGHEDLAYELLYQEKCPSWLFEVKRGATTIWESWFSYDENDEPIPTSHNHYAFGCVDDWIFRNICGIEGDEPGFKHIVINPRPDASLTYAKRDFSSEHGRVSCAWRREDGAFHLEATIPSNTTATIMLPNGERHEVGSGSYEFDI